MILPSYTITVSWHCLSRMGMWKSNEKHGTVLRFVITSGHNNFLEAVCCTAWHFHEQLLCTVISHLLIWQTWTEGDWQKFNCQFGINANNCIYLWKMQICLFCKSQYFEKSFCYPEGRESGQTLTWPYCPNLSSLECCGLEGVWMLIIC